MLQQLFVRHGHQPLIVHQLPGVSVADINRAQHKLLLLLVPDRKKGLSAATPAGAKGTLPIGGNKCGAQDRRVDRRGAMVR